MYNEHSRTADLLAKIGLTVGGIALACVGAKVLIDRFEKHMNKELDANTGIAMDTKPVKER